MRILVVAATAAETAPLAAALNDRDAGDPRLVSYTRGRHQIDALHTGVGMVATAVWCSRTLGARHYDLALNVGLCGTFDPTLPLGTVVHIVSEQLTELGAEDGEAFLTLEQLKLIGADEFPFHDGCLRNVAPPSNDVLNRLPAVRGITVNTVHGNETSIVAVAERFNPQVESMEGAAFMYACLIHQVPFAEVRAVSNLVERRRREGWKVMEAIQCLGESTLAILDCA